MRKAAVYNLMFFVFLGLRLIILFSPEKIKEFLVYKKTDGPAHNVILISIDTLRADHLGCYGYSRETSPNIDRLAEESVVFETPISQSAWTLPAHASMMTGKLPSGLGLVFYDEEGLENKNNIGKMDRRQPTIARSLKRYGYETVSYNGGAWVAGEFGLDAGFDTYKWGGRYFEDNVARAIQWLERKKPKRFFLFLHGYDVHTPYNAPEEYNIFYDYQGELDKENIVPGKTPAPQGSPEHLYIISQYDAGIRRADHQIGLFLEYLRQKDLLDQSIVIVTSDHGEALQDLHAMWGHIYPLYEELIRVPLIIRAPGLETKRISGQVPASTSLYPTILEMLGIQQHGVDRSHSLVGCFRGKSFQFDEVISETGRWKRKRLCQSVRTPRWKLCFFQEEGREERYELYDLQEDGGESRSVAEIQPQIVGALRGRLPRLALDRRIMGKRRDLDEQTIEQLRSLGYIRK